MGWSLKLGKIAGILVQVHFTFLIFRVWIVLSGLMRGKSQEVVLSNLVFMLGLFGCVVLHEFGHALTARRYGIRTRDITLLPIGGLARLERMPEDPRQELWVALAGPAVNVVIASGLAMWLYVMKGMPGFYELNMGTGSFGERIFLVNVSLLAFNMLPAFPMDGGRVVRALLAIRMNYAKATQIAARLGQSMAVLFGLVGLLSNPMMMFIALFVWMGAAQELNQVIMKAALSGIPVSEAMMTTFESVAPPDSLEHISRLILRGSQQDFPVLEGGRVVGVVTRGGVLKALTEQTEAQSPQPVSAVMFRDVATTEASAMLEGALQALQEAPCHTLPVLRDGKLVGLLTAENLSEYLMIWKACNGRVAGALTVYEEIAKGGTEAPPFVVGDAVVS